MIIGQLALCEECRDGSCCRCKNYIRRQKRKYPNAVKSHIILEAAMKAGMPIAEVVLDKIEEQDILGLPAVKDEKSHE